MSISDILQPGMITDLMSRDIRRIISSRMDVADQLDSSSRSVHHLRLQSASDPPAQGSFGKSRGKNSLSSPSITCLDFPYFDEWDKLSESFRSVEWMFVACQLLQLQKICYF